MRLSLFTIALLSAAATFAQRPTALPADATPVQLAQAQLDAYNDHDLERFLEPYADTVAVYTMPAGQVQYRGKAAMRGRYGPYFEQNPALHCQLLNRIVQGNVVMDHEHVTGREPQPVRVVATYVIEGGRIARVYFWR